MIYLYNPASQNHPSQLTTYEGLHIARAVDVQPCTPYM